MNKEDFDPVIPTQQQTLDIVNSNTNYQTLAALILKNIPISDHRTTALRLLLESKMTLIHGITHHIPVDTQIAKALETTVKVIKDAREKDNV